MLDGVFVLDPDPLGGDEGVSALLGVASGIEGRDEDEDAFGSLMLVGGSAEGANEDGVGAGGTVNERLGLFAPIVAEVSAAGA